VYYSIYFPSFLMQLLPLSFSLWHTQFQREVAL